MNTENRREAQRLGNKCEASNSKLKNNALFGKENNMKIIYLYILIGKTCENVRKYRNIRIVREPEKAMKNISKFTFSNCKQYGDLLAIEMRKEEVELNKPYYIGSK